MVVANGLVPKRHQAICNNYDDVGSTKYVIIVQHNIILVMLLQQLDPRHHKISLGLFHVDMPILSIKMICIHIKKIGFSKDVSFIML